MGRLLDEDMVINALQTTKFRNDLFTDRGYARAISIIRELPTIQPEKTQLSQQGTTSDQPVATDTNVGDKISKFIDGLEEIFADLRERHVDDSVCGLCEYDGAYMGQSGDWCNECPGFDRDDCFKLSDETRRKWTTEIIKAQPPVQPEPQWILCDERMPEEHEWIGTKKFGTTISDEVYVTFENEKGERFCKHLSFQNGKLSSYDQFHMDTWYKGSKPIAWMPLPKPFEGGTE